MSNLGGVTRVDPCYRVYEGTPYVLEFPIGDYLEMKISFEESPYSPAATFSKFDATRHDRSFTLRKSTDTASYTGFCNLIELKFQKQTNNIKSRTITDLYLSHDQTRKLNLHKTF